MRTFMMQRRFVLEELHYRTYCRLQPSPIHGVGVFAIRAIPEGKDPFSGGPAIPQSVRDLPVVELSQQQVEELPFGVAQLVCDLGFQEEGYWLVPSIGFNLASLEWYVNHSPEPNMYYKCGHFYTLWEIKDGEELTVDYRTYGDPVKGIEKWPASVRRGPGEVSTLGYIGVRYDPVNFGVTIIDTIKGAGK